jgi:hypothetical protein
MSSLSSLQINQSYQGLLKLADSTTGITQTLQSVQDGLGNDTGIKLAQDFFSAPSVLSYKPLGRSTGGNGIATGGGTAFVTGSVNKLYGNFFYEQDNASYTGITFRVGTVTSTADEINMAFYTVEQTGQYGIAPKDLIMSGITLDAADLAATGLVTKALPSTLTFPHPGAYCLMLYVTNPGVVNPTARLTAPAEIALQMGMLSMMYGFVPSVDGSAAQNPYYGASTESTSVYYNTNAPFVTSFTPSTIAATAQSTTISIAGFILRK